jgi:hypothetical protein
MIFFAIVFVDNILNRSDIQTPLAIDFFVFETDTIQLRNASLLNLFILNAKMLVKTIRRPRETMILSQSFETHFVGFG